MNRSVKAFLIIAGIAAAAVVAIGPVRLYKAREEADAFAEEKGIGIVYQGSEDLSTKEAFLTEIRQIALWEEDTRTAVNAAFGHTDKEYAESESGTPSGYGKEKELLAFAMKEKWRKLRKDLDRSVKDAITQTFDKAQNTYGLDEQSVQTCYAKNHFEKINAVMRSVEDGSGMEAYDLARYGLGHDWSALPMDIAFGLRPKLITAGCEASLLSAVKSNELYEVTGAVGSAELFADRYHVTVDGLESAKKKEKSLEYASRPDVPTVGMSTSKARATKLGAPTRTTTETGSWMHKKHTYGNMYWERDGKQIFSAHYSDGEITEVYDTRNSTAKSPWVSSRKSSSKPSSKTSFDPDDHDIEAYFEDNRDEYGDYDEAYEGFLDDEGAWDDY